MKTKINRNCLYFSKQGKFTLLFTLLLLHFNTFAQNKKNYGVVQYSAQKIIALGNPELLKSSAHILRSGIFVKAFDDTARARVGGINVKLVKNPSFGVNTPPTYNATTLNSSTTSSTDNSGTAWDCATSSVVLTANSTNFLNANYATQAGKIYPGAIYAFNDFFGGNPNPIAGKRRPMQLTIDSRNISGNAYINVENPTLGNTTTAVIKLSNELRGDPANSSFTTTTYQTSNNDASKLQISGGGSYAGFTVNASYGTSSKSNTINVTVDATKILYSISVTPPDSGYYIDPKIENTKNLMVIGRVSYGVRVLANFTYTFNSTAAQEAFNAKYGGFGTSANIDLKALQSDTSVSTTINCYIVGGPANIPTSFNKADFETNINKALTGVTYTNAQPISYSFWDMADNVLGSYSATDAFTDRSCVPNDNKATFVSAYVNYTTSQQPGDNKDNDTHYHVTVYPGTAQSRNNYNGYDENNPPQVKNNGEPFLFDYRTGPLNIEFSEGTSHLDQLTLNKFLPNGLTPKIPLKFFVDNGGIIHFHIYPNGNDTWGISQVVLTLNFTGGITKKVSFPQQPTGSRYLVLTQDSREATLYFDGTFAPRQ